MAVPKYFKRLFREYVTGEGSSEVANQSPVQSVNSQTGDVTVSAGGVIPPSQTVTSYSDLPTTSRSQAEIWFVSGENDIVASTQLSPVVWRSLSDYTNVTEGIIGSAIAGFDASAISRSDGDSITEFDDRVGTYNLSGSATLRTGSNGIGGENALEMGSFSETSLELAQPYTIAAVYSGGNDSKNELTGDQSDGRPNLVKDSGGSQVTGMNAGTFLPGNATNSPEIAFGLFDGSDSDLRQNGANTASGDAGTQGYDSGIHIGESPDGRGGFNGLFGELVIYQSGLTPTELAYEENRLSNRWNIPI